MPPGIMGSPHWECISTKNWLGFRNIASYGHLGRDKQWRLCCSASKHQEWEQFSTTSRSDGSHVLLMRDWEALRPVGFKEENGKRDLAMIDGETATGIAWEFVEV